MFHKCLKHTLHGPFAHQNGRSLYMIKSQLNDSLCFKEIMGNFCGNINTFECYVLYIFLKKVHFTEGQTTLTAPNSHFKHC